MAKTLYKSDRITLSEIIKRATSNATYLVPDLQRPYVWAPNQVTLLVDSLFKGWPFGSLLTWEVKPEIVDGQLVEGIPSRPFYTKVSRGVPDVNPVYAHCADRNFATTDIMVLDGQQRLQSLVLALGETDGLCLSDSEWERSLDPTSRARARAGYTTGVLCLNLNKYLAAMTAGGHMCRNIDLAECLEWAVVDVNQCSAYHKCNRIPLPQVNAGGNVYFPLRRIWGATDTEHTDVDEELVPLAVEFINSAFPPDTEAKTHFLEERGGADLVHKDLAKLFARFCELKDIELTCLKVGAYQENQNASPEEKTRAKQEYDDAIVNIFTRLNTAGRTLTREEITFAWVKSTWKDVRPENMLYRSAEQFVGRVGEVFSDWELSADEIIRGLSIIWCNHDPERGGHPLETRELLQAKVIRRMSAFLKENADLLIESAELTHDVYSAPNLWDMADSFNGVTIAWDLCFSGEMSRGRLASALNEHEKDSTKKILKDEIKFFVSRWIVLPSWGRKWANEAVAFLQQTMQIQSSTVGEIVSAASLELWKNSVREQSRSINQNAIAGALANLRLRLFERKVYMYRSRLEVWQALNEERAKSRRLTFQDANAHATPELNVDHIIAWAYWQERIREAFENGSLQVGDALRLFSGMTEAEIAQKLAADPARSKEQAKTDALGYINNIGNCMILNAGYNISKRKKPLSEFMDQMYEFSEEAPAAVRVDRNHWMNVMRLNDAFINPVAHTIEEIVNAINARESLIYDELESFVNNIEPVLH